MKFICNVLLVGAGVVLLSRASFCVSLGGEGSGDPDNTREGETKTDKILQVVSLISEQFTKLKHEVSLISDKLNQHAKISQDKFTELKQDVSLISDKLNEDTKLSEDNCSELKQEVSLISDKLNEHTKLSKDNFSELKQEVSVISDKLNKYTNKFTELKQEISLISEKLNEHANLSQDNCSELKQEVDSPLDQDACIKGQPHTNGTKRITLWGNTTALCDTTTDEGGWIIIQRRTNGDVDFFRGWNEYKTGFGNLDTDFWLGNDAIHLLTVEGYTELRIDMIYKGRRVYAHYLSFYVASKAWNYRLTVDAFEGTAGDSLAFHNSMPFSTFDRDNDKWKDNCADVFKGAWWYNNCLHSNLNALWGKHESYDGMAWFTLTEWNSVSFSEMKVRRG